MKRLLFCLLAAGVALSTSAFTSVASKPHFQVYYYVLTTNGNYVRISSNPDPANCAGTVLKKCYLGYSTDQGTGFPASNVPANFVVQSQTNGLYID